MADDEGFPLRTVGWGPFMLPGERKRMRRLKEKYDLMAEEFDREAAANSEPPAPPADPEPEDRGEPTPPPGGDPDHVVHWFITSPSSLLHDPDQLTLPWLPAPRVKASRPDPHHTSREYLAALFRQVSLINQQMALDPAVDTTYDSQRHHSILPQEGHTLPEDLAAVRGHYDLLIGYCTVTDVAPNIPAPNPERVERSPDR